MHKRSCLKVPTVPPEVAAYEEPVDLEELVGDTTLAQLNDIFKSIMQKNRIALIRYVLSSEGLKRTGFLRRDDAYVRRVCKDTSLFQL